MNNLLLEIISIQLGVIISLLVFIACRLCKK